MPKHQPQTKTVLISISFPDPDLVEQMDIAAAADAGPGEIPNRSRWARNVIRRALTRQGIKVGPRTRKTRTA